MAFHGFLCGTNIRDVCFPGDQGDEHQPVIIVCCMETVQMPCLGKLGEVVSCGGRYCIQLHNYPWGGGGGVHDMKGMATNWSKPCVRWRPDVHGVPMGEMRPDCCTDMV